jgi:hypothetical protein
MKARGRICVVTAAAFGVIASWGAASAQADGICKVNESPCKEANAWPVGTVLETTIKPGTEISFKGAIKGTMETLKCTGSTWSGELTQNPTKGIAALLKGLSETFTGCHLGGGNCGSAKATEFFSGAKWFASPGSPGNGYTGGTTPIARYVELICAGVPCKWEFSSSEASSHTYQGGNPAKESWSWRYVKKEGTALFCGAEMTMSGEREFAGPKGSVFWTVS